MHMLLLSRNASLPLQLGAAPFRRADLQLEVATSGEEALAAHRRSRPEVFLLDTRTAEPDAFQVCEQFKRDPDLKALRTVLLFGPRLSREQLDRAEAVRCDDLVCTPASDEELFEHVAMTLGLPLRAAHRVAVHMRAHVSQGARETLGWLENLSREGARVTLDGPIDAGGEVRARFERQDGRAIEVVAKVVWQRAVIGAGKQHAIGLRFVSLDAGSRLLLEEICLWEITRRPNSTLVSIQGMFNEATRLDGLYDALEEGHPVIEFDLADVYLFNSAGVRPWARLLRLLGNATIRFIRCSQAFTMQAARVPDVVGPGTVISMWAPFRCDGCDREQIRPLQAAAIVIDDTGMYVPSFACPACGGALRLDDMPQEYLQFLRDP